MLVFSACIWSLRATSSTECPNKRNVRSQNCLFNDSQVEIPPGPKHRFEPDTASDNCSNGNRNSETKDYFWARLSRFSLQLLPTQLQGKYCFVSCVWLHNGSPWWRRCTSDHSLAFVILVCRTTLCSPQTFLPWSLASHPTKTSTKNAALATNV